MKILLPSTLEALVRPALPSLAQPIEVVLLDDDGAPQGPVEDAEVLIRWWFGNQRLRQLIADAPGLRWLHTPSAGVDSMPFPELRERGIVLTNAAGSQAPSIAEFVLAGMLAYVKQIPLLLAAQRERRWVEGLELRELTGATLLIIGLGAIGQELARRAAAFDMRVVGSRRSAAAVPGVAQVVGADEWRALLPEADFVVVAAPLTAATRGMLDQAAFAAMKPGAYFVNIARGQIVDEDALVEALRAQHLGGALLDALSQEPLPATSALWDVPGLTITPHISWSSPLVKLRNAEILLENLRRYCAGQELRNIVDQEAGY